ncbi:hypothetical protein AR687_14330 [Flavobacteriaceae bacterium CRH]|nr:hypothetical protein AR687_14330 [Flavobacteriaceae bacterium CRH]
MNNKYLKIMPFWVNFILIGFIIFLFFKTDSDKSPLIFLVLHPIVVLINLIFLLIFWFKKNELYINIFKRNILLLFTFILPLLIFICCI